MDVAHGDAPGRKARRQLIQKGGRSAQVEVGLTRHAKRLENLYTEAPRSVVVRPLPIIGTGTAVLKIFSAVRQILEKISRLSGERMFCAIASAEQPPDFTW
jgi:hypothetical protein